MTTRLEEFKAAMLEIGGEEIIRQEAEGTKESRMSRLLSKLGRRAAKAPTNSMSAKEDDIFDATVIVVDRETDSGKSIHPETQAAFYMPVKNRAMVGAALKLMGLEFEDIYIQEGAAGNQWVQVSLEADSEFRMYAGTRYLLDGAPAEGGVIGVDPDALELALTGEIFKNEA